MQFMISCVSYSNSYVIFARASTLLSYYMSNIIKVLYMSLLALAFSVCSLWFYFLIFFHMIFRESNLVWDQTRN